MKYSNISGVPDFSCTEFHPRSTKYCILIPVINEGERIARELKRAQDNGIGKLCDIIICDGGSTDGSTGHELLTELGVNTLLIKESAGKLSAQMRMGFWWAHNRGYEGFITIDGNDKDSIEDVPLFTEKLDDGYDFVQGSRFISGGKAVNTPITRYIAIKYIHAPVISLTAGERFTDTTSNYRAYSLTYITHPCVNLYRDVFDTYELLAYLSVRASQLKLKTCEVPVSRIYPEKEKTPTKISFLKGNSILMKILFNNLRGKYN